jgi:hypothetical protein
MTLQKVEFAHYKIRYEYKRGYYTDIMHIQNETRDKIAIQSIQSVIVSFSNY